MTENQVYAGAALLGVIAGMRSMSAPALISGLAHQGLLPERNNSLRILAHPATVSTTALLAAGELVADKLPFTPSRTTTGPLLTRVISGAMCGAAITSAKGRSVPFGILVGACAAVGATFAAYHVRRYIGTHSPIPDPAIAVAEDAVTAGGAWLVFKTLKK